MILQNCKINGKLDAKPSKSIFQRLLALSFLAESPTIIQNASFCDDSISVLNILNTLGCQIIQLENKIQILPNILDEDFILNCNESALAIRMFSPILSLFDHKYTLIASKTLQKRKLFEIETILGQLGALVRTNAGYPPIQVKGPIKPSIVNLNAYHTSQFLTGLLIALPKLEGTSQITLTNISSKPYVDITIDLVSKFGGNIKLVDSYCYICNHSHYFGSEFYCENDWSNAAVFLIAGAIGGKCEVTSLNVNSKQGDKIILDVLAQVGAKIKFDDNSIIVQKSELKPFEFTAKNYPDLVPILSVLALNCEGKSKIYDVDRLKYKEINRLEKIINIFKQNNLKINYANNCLEINGSNYSFDYIDTDGDHRFAMAAALISINNPKPIKIINHKAITKSYPEFFEDFQKIQDC